MKEKRLRYKILLGLFILGMLLIAFVLFRQNASMQDQLISQKKLIEEQKAVIDSKKKEGLKSLMANLLDQIDDELKDNPDRNLSDGTIARIAIFSDACEPEPFSYVENDSAATDNFSRERAYLLLTLNQMNLDSNSFEKIKLQTNFAKADLADMDLSGSDLSGIKLMSANLRGAKMNESKLDHADLRGANLWGAKLTGASLDGAQMNRADLSWADMDGANLEDTILKGAKLENAKLRQAHLTGTVIFYADLRGAFLNESVLDSVNLFGSDLRRTDFSETVLSDVDLRRANLIESDLYQSNLNEVRLDRVVVKEKNWLNLLDQWSVVGAKEIQEAYRIVGDKSGRGDYALSEIKE